MSDLETKIAELKSTTETTSDNVSNILDNTPNISLITKEFEAVESSATYYSSLPGDIIGYMYTAGAEYCIFANNILSITNRFSLPDTNRTYVYIGAGVKLEILLSGATDGTKNALYTLDGTNSTEITMWWWNLNGGQINTYRNLKITPTYKGVTATNMVTLKQVIIGT